MIPSICSNKGSKEIYFAFLPGTAGIISPHFPIFSSLGLRKTSALKEDIRELSFRFFTLATFPEEPL